MSKSLVSKINIVLRGIQLISIHLVGGNFGQGQICIRGRRGLLTTMWQLAGCTVWWVLKGGEGYLWGRWGWRWPTIYIGLQIFGIFSLMIECILCLQATFLYTGVWNGLFPTPFGHIHFPQFSGMISSRECITFVTMQLTWKGWLWPTAVLLYHLIFSVMNQNISVYIWPTAQHLIFSAVVTHDKQVCDKCWV